MHFAAAMAGRAEEFGAFWVWRPCPLPRLHTRFVRLDADTLLSLAHRAQRSTPEGEWQAYHLPVQPGRRGALPKLDRARALYAALFRSKVFRARPSWSMSHSLVTDGQYVHFGVHKFFPKPPARLPAKRRRQDGQDAVPAPSPRPSAVPDEGGTGVESTGLPEGTPPAPGVSTGTRRGGGLALANTPAAPAAPIDAAAATPMEVVDSGIDLLRPLTAEEEAFVAGVESGVRPEDEAVGPRIGTYAPTCGGPAPCAVRRPH